MMRKITSEKPKRQAKSDYYPRTFLPIWLLYSVLVYPLGAIVGLIGSFIFSAITLGIIGLRYGYLSDETQVIWSALGYLVLGILVGLCVGMLQKERLVHYFQWSATYWRCASFLGAGVGASVVLVFFKVTETETDPSLLLSRWLFVMPTFITCVALCQWFVLRRVVNRAWYWLVANLLGGIGFSMIFSMAGFFKGWGILVFPVLAMLGQGLITGMALKFLFAQRAWVDFSAGQA